VTEPTTVAATLATGAVLGWSVAWPPGPINAEIIRRGLTRGFWSAFVVGLGASCADFFWALAVALGAGALVSFRGVRPVLGAVSLTLLLFLAWRYLAGAWRGLAAFRRGDPVTRPGALDSTRAGYFLGFGLALSSPWNLAFWLAVLGHHEGPAATLGSSLLLALAVVTAATTWTLVLSTAVQLGARFATPLWDVGTRAATGLVLLAFAALLLRKLLG